MTHKIAVRSDLAVTSPATLGENVSYTWRVVSSASYSEYEMKAFSGEGREGRREGGKNESKSHSICEERPLTPIIKGMLVFGESEIAPSSVVFYNTNCL